MLTEMRIRDLGVIADATLEPAPGLTVVTGETGAGKTMVVAGLGLLFGGRADTGRIRAGSARARVEGRLALDRDSRAVVRAEEAGAEVDEDGTLVLARTVSVEGRSRAHVGGCAAPVGLLAELADDVLTVHGQTDSTRLLRPAEQRAALDRYTGAKVTALLDRHRDLYRRWRAVDEDLAERRNNARERAQQADLLRHGLAEIEAAAPQPGEDEELRREAGRLDHADTLRAAAAGAHEALAGDPAGLYAAERPDAVGLLGAARRALESAGDHDPALKELAGRLDEIAYLAADVATELASYVESIDADPARLAQVHERRAALTALARRYGAEHGTVAEVLAWAEDAAAGLLALDGSEETLAALAAERDALAAELGTVSGKLSRARTRAGDRFAAAVTAELAGLAMPHAEVSVAVEQRVVADDEHSRPAVRVGDRLLAVGPDGVDEVELRLVPHPGAPPRPLQRGASGGELSRVMLAVEVVFAGADGVPTMVFDEVDAGVGGKAAVEVGRRLARLARNHQVLVVTHLAQVAAYADRHVVVTKGDDGSVTTSGLRTVEGADRAQELARMLAGLEDSELALRHAEELMGVAGADRAG